jgi:hypothetical protein
MAAADRTLEILIRTRAELAALEQTKAKLDEVKGKTQEVSTQAASAGESFSELGSLMGLALGAGILGGVLAVSNAITQWGEEIRKSADEQLRLTQEINASVLKIDELVKHARTLRDVIQIADAFKLELAKMAVAMSKFRADELPLWQKFADTIAHMFGSAIPGFGPRPFEQAAQENLNRTQQEYNRLVTDAGVEIVRSADATKQWAEEQKKLPESLTLCTDRVTALRGTLDQLTESLRISPEDVEIQEAFRGVAKDLQEAEERLTILQRGQDKVTRSTRETGGAHREITALMREQQGILQNLHQQESLVEQSPFLTVDQKNTQLLALYAQQIQVLSGIIDQTRSAMAGSALDPAQYQLLNNKLQTTIFELEQLQLKLQTLSFGGAFRAELTQWVNSFGSAGQQAARAITGPMNTAIGGISQGLTGLIFGAKNWQQSFVQAAQSIVQQLIQIGLQLLVQKALGTVMTTATVAEQAVAGPAVATAWAPAAAATSVGSFGASATTGAGAAIAAIAAIMGALMVGHEGGVIGGAGLRRFHGGGLASDEVPLIAQVGEIIMRREVAQPLAPILLALNARRFHAGGQIGGGISSIGGGISGGGDKITILNFTDKKALVKELATREGRKIIVDTINGRRIDLGLS